MQVLKRGHTELFRRGPDECFDSLAGLTRFCQEQKEKSVDRWVPPRSLRPRPLALDRLVIDFADPGAKQSEEAYQMNDWSFTQLCQLAKVSRDTVNRVTADTAWRVFGDTLPDGNKPLQLYTEGNIIRSIHGVSYTRLYNADILAMLAEFATDFQPPQKAAFGGKNDSGGTGLYAGEQDMFVFLIDPTGWAEIEGQAFAPGFFIWNSEVGKRSLGIQTFWFQAICQNHIVWDAVEVVEFTRKHTASIQDSLAEMRRIVEQLVAKRDERRDGFVKVIAKAIHVRLGADAEEVAKVLLQHGIGRTWAKQALQIAEKQGRFTIFAMVDALTRMAGENLARLWSISAFAISRHENGLHCACEFYTHPHADPGAHQPMSSSNCEKARVFRGLTEHLLTSGGDTATIFQSTLHFRWGRASGRDVLVPAEMSGQNGFGVKK